MVAAIVMASQAPVRVARKLEKTCCPWSHGLWLVVPPAHVRVGRKLEKTCFRVPSQRPLAPSVPSVANDMDDAGGCAQISWHI